MPVVDSLGIVIPVYDDAEVLAELHGRLKRVVADLSAAHEILFVDDGSRDGSLAELERLREADPDTVIVQLARNFGQHNAIAAGLAHVRGDVVVVMDSDLQDPPEDIPKLVAALEDSGCEMAVARWATRPDASTARGWLRAGFRLLARTTALRYAPELGVFRAIRRRAVDAVLDMPPTRGSILSRLHWAGHSHVPVDLHRGRRHAGRSGYTWRRVLGLATDRYLAYARLPAGPAGRAGRRGRPRYVIERIIGRD